MNLLNFTVLFKFNEDILEEIGAKNPTNQNGKILHRVLCYKIRVEDVKFGNRSFDEQKLCSARLEIQSVDDAELCSP